MGGTSMSGAPDAPGACRAPAGRPAPLRRLTRFEYDNTIRDLLGDASRPAQALPAETLGNGFGNDAATQAVSSLLVEQYAAVAAAVATRATATPGKLIACADDITPATEPTCARTFIEGFGSRAFRRPLLAGEADELVDLFRGLRALPDADFASALAGVIEAVLQSPDFLYRAETPTGDGALDADARATRLSYLLWGTMPDETLRAAARAGELDTAAGIARHAQRMLADARTRAMVRFFFDNVLPITGLAELERSSADFPTFTPAIGGFMREETQRVLENELFDGGGTWSGALTAAYTFLNGPLAGFYGVASVNGPSWRKVALDGRRLGILTHASVMAGTTHSSHTNPVVRGAFIANKLLCVDIPPPDASIADKVKPPDPYAGKTARERFTQHRADPVCSGCHALMDPLGLALENFDAVGLHRVQENGVDIDARGAIPGLEGEVAGPVELVRKLATVERVHACFAAAWLALAFGKSLSADDGCLRATVADAFRQSGHDVRQLLLALTQTEAFLQR
jgi:hypothetical protein